MTRNHLESLSLPSFMILTLQIHRFWKTPVMQDLMENYLISILPLVVTQMKEIQVDLLSHLMRRLLEVQESFTRVHMCYKCFCSTLVFILPKKNKLLWVLLFLTSCMRKWSWYVFIRMSHSCALYILYIWANGSPDFSFKVRMRTTSSLETLQLIKLILI